MREEKAHVCSPVDRRPGKRGKDEQGRARDVEDDGESEQELLPLTHARFNDL